MFGNLSHLALQQYWWVIVSLLAALLVFLLFVQGGQTLIYSLGKTEEKRKLIVNALGHKWEFTFTTLVTFGGAFFASFPLFYSTSFGGAYWVWMAILFAFVIQAVSYEYRTKPKNVFGKKTFEVFLFLNGALGTILLGTAVSTFFTGSQFSVAYGINGIQNSEWAVSSYGLEAVLNFQNVALGLAVFFLARLLGLMYINKNVEDEEIESKIKGCTIRNSVAFLVFFLSFVVMLVLKDGFAYDPETGVVFMEEYKYLHNLLEMPLNTAIFLIGVVFVLVGIYKGIFKQSKKAINWAGLGTVLTVFALFILAGFNNTSFYPSTHDLQSSLTIENASSSHRTLTAMSWVSLMAPVVLLYIWFVWRAMNKKKISKQELESDDHVY
jgi:cytochrome d ubiquinol oxidase subunit II